MRERESGGERKKEKKTARERDRQTDRQRHRQTERERERDRHRQRETEREGGKGCCDYRFKKKEGGWSPRESRTLRRRGRYVSVRQQRQSATC